jgi:hypothetical protein
MNGQFIHCIKRLIGLWDSFTVEIIVYLLTNHFNFQFTKPSEAMVF